MGSRGRGSQGRNRGSCRLVSGVGRPGRRREDRYPSKTAQMPLYGDFSIKGA